MQKISISWSGGKDCMMALEHILARGEYEVCSLHTTFNDDTQRVGLHGVRQELIEAQASALGLPLEKIFVSSSMNHDEYIKQTTQYYHSLKARGIAGVVFGDLFLEDLKLFRENMLTQCGLAPIFPLWKRSTAELAREFIRKGFKAVICSADARYFSEAGTEYDQQFIERLPKEVDPCGENGEFHTFVYDGSLFGKAVAIAKGEIVDKEYTFKSVGDNGTDQLHTSKFWFRELRLGQ